MKLKIGIIGLGYVGLPLAISFSKKYQVIGFDLNKKRINSLSNVIDCNLDLQNKELSILKKKKINFTHNEKDLKKINFYIITVPTPVNKSKKPEFKYLINASKLVGKYLKKNDIVVYESTVYPGATDEICIPVLEKISGLKINKDFYVGFSPERLSPGDNSHGLEKITKITSGSNPKSSKIIDKIYKSIIKRGTFLVSSIKAAEATKIIENTQRDLNIAFVNELTQIFHRLNLNTKEILDAAATKWNFLKFQPGLVGGHCIAVDPYYFLKKCNDIKYKNKLILPARSVNDSMTNFVCLRTLGLIKNLKRKVKKTKILLMGFSYKENSTDVRNTPVADIFNYLKKKGISELDIYDPIVNKMEVLKKFKIKVNDKIDKKYDIIILCVPHKKIINFLNKSIKKITYNGSKIFDIKYVLKKNKNIIQL